MKKIETAAKLMMENENIFRCPVCESRMKVEDRSIICENKHCFDISKHGYVNLLKKAVKSDYDEELFKSRNVIMNSGFYDEMIEKISEIILEQISKKNGTVYILDAGCGEGSHLKKVTKLIKSKTNKKIQSVGIDISKDAAKIASKDGEGFIWCTSDLAAMPFGDKKFDVILNILSPSNNAEFKRVLKDDGMVIKVVPGENYLKELREMFYKGSSREQYSNEDVVNNFKSGFRNVFSEKVSYKVILDGAKLMHLIKMTPLSWNVDDEKIKKACEMPSCGITVDLLIMSNVK